MKPITIEQIVTASCGELLSGSVHQQIEQFTIDSREPSVNGLFVPIVGEKTDGHRYAEGALKQGAVALFLQKDSIYREEILALAKEKKAAVIAVEDTLKALQQTAAWYRSCFSLPVVGITGSVGKTTTKEMIAAALETEKKVLKTIGNKNSQIGLSQMMFYLDERFDIAVIEMGMSQADEMKHLTRIAKPECAVMTNIGVAHIAQLGSKENIRKEKLSIANEFSADSVLFVNGNDALLSQTATEITHKELTIDCSKETKTALEQAKAVTFGIGEGFDYAASAVTAKTNGVSFLLTIKRTKQQIPVQLKVYGEHNVRNALAAIAVADYYGIAPKRAIEGLSCYEPIAMRGQIKEKNGITWIDDTYNASPDSMKSGIQVLLSLQADRRIAVLADVLELGEQSERFHREVGAYVASFSENGKQTDSLVTVGKEASFLADEARKNGMKEVYAFSSNEDAVLHLKNYLQSGDAVLVKGSRGMKTEEILNQF